MKNNTKNESNEILLNVTDMDVTYKAKNFLGRLKYQVRAVNNVSFELKRGETFGLVGESGSGKTTVGRALLRLIERDSGSVKFEENELEPSVERGSKTYKNMQAIFQDPYASLNPSHLIEHIVGEPIKRHLSIKGEQCRSMVYDLLEKVGLLKLHAQRYTYELSGGQRQRIAIAKALAPSPKLIVCDEPVSALDVSTQAQVVNLLQDLQKELSISYIFIAHDLAVVRCISHNIGVINLGWMIETGPSDRVCDYPAHPYTEMLLASVPIPNPAEQRRRRALRKRLSIPVDPPSPMNPPPGCPYEPRCKLALDICRKEMPSAVPVQGGGNVRCHLHTSGPKLEGRSVKELIELENS